MNLKKLLIIQNSIPHYRIPFYNYLSNYYDLTVIHSGSKLLANNIKFFSQKLDLIKFGPFFYQRKLKNIVKKHSPDVIIIMFNLRWISSFALLPSVKKVKIIFWGLDEGKSSLALKIKLWIGSIGYPQIFYQDYIKNKFVSLGMGEEFCFTANNTFHVERRIKSYNYEKHHLIFVGSLDKRKMLDTIIDSFINANSIVKGKFKFLIIGDGAEGVKLKSKIQSLGQSSKILLLGKINNTDKLAKYYKNAIASISYGQAGLAVLQAFAYGVPYITKKGAITGGELYNIKNNYNGIIVEEGKNKLDEALKTIFSNIELAKKLGENAHGYYTKNCTIRNMLEGFKNAIKYQR